MSPQTEPDHDRKSRPDGDSDLLSKILEQIDGTDSGRWILVGANSTIALPGKLDAQTISSTDFLEKIGANFEQPLPDGLLLDGVLFGGIPFDGVLLDISRSSRDATVGAQELSKQLFAALARILTPEGRLFLVWQLPDSDPTPSPDRSSVEALAQEAGFRLQRTMEMSSPSGARNGLTLVFLRDGFRLRSGDETDLPQILELFERSFHHARPEEHWRWKYQQNPWGNERITVIESEVAFAASDSSPATIVGQYCAYPVPWIRYAESTKHQTGHPTMLCHQVGDTMTARKVRAVGRGPTSLLARAARHFYHRHCRGQVAFNYGFNTGNIREFSKRFVGALDVMPAPYRTLDLPRPAHDTPPDNDPSSLPSFLRRVKGWITHASLADSISHSSDKVQVRRMERLDERFDQLVAESLPVYRLLVERSCKYLEWRYLSAPDVEYKLYAASVGQRLLGWGVFREREGDLVWGDALFADEAAGRTAAGAILDHALAEAGSAQRVVAWFNPHPLWWGSWLEDVGLHRRPEPNDLAMVVVPFEWPDPVAALQTELYLTMGDSDLF